MKTKIILAFALIAVAAFGQTALTQTTTSAAITANQQLFNVASTTNITNCSVANPCPIYVMDPGNYRGELMNVTSVPASGQVNVQRGSNYRAAHVSGAVVLIANGNNRAQSFRLYDPVGSCTTANTLYTPWVNVNNGNQWLCSTVTLSWVPGFGNAFGESPMAVTTAVASAAGTITPSGPLFHVTGTSAITGLTLPVGYNGGPICVIPDGVFTTTAAGNIALASTAVVSKTLCFTYDVAAAKPFFPSY